MFLKDYLVSQDLSESLAILIKSNAQIQKLFDAMPSAIEEFLRDSDANSKRNPPLLSSTTTIFNTIPAARSLFSFKNHGINVTPLKSKIERGKDPCN